MKRHFLLGIFIFVLAAMGLSSCNNDDLQADMAVDVFTVTRWGADSTIIYGLALHDYGNKDLSKVTVTGPSGTQYSLSSYMGLTYDFYQEPDSELFSKTMPATGNYTFDATFSSGETLEDEDVLNTSVLQPAKITSFEFDADTVRFELHWKPVEDADYYVVDLYDGDGDIVFNGSLAASSSSSLLSGSITAASEGWLNDYSPVNGTKYKVSVQSYAYQNSTSSFYIKAKSIADAWAVWGN